MDIEDGQNSCGMKDLYKERLCQAFDDHHHHIIDSDLTEQLNMSFPYKHVLIIGATSGIGRAMVDHFIANGLKITAVGRRQDRLEEIIVQHGSEKASGVAFDVEKLDKIPVFINK
jgi:NADP-dependent 3-hydroxy acid dehydrogenase YdfG